MTGHPWLWPPCGPGLPCLEWTRSSSECSYCSRWFSRRRARPSSSTSRVPETLEGFRSLRPGGTRRRSASAAIQLATAVALVVHPTAWLGGVAALVLLLAFIGGIARAMAHGQAPDCHCFGQLHSAPAGRATLARNAALAVLAGVLVVTGPGPPIDDWGPRAASPSWWPLGSVSWRRVGGCRVRLWLDNRGLRGDLARERDVTALLPPGLPVGTTAPAFARRT